MLGAARASVGFYCPGCGTGLQAPRADAGTAIDCPRCGELVRVPRRPHPVESETDAAPLISPPAAARAADGVRLLHLSLVLFAVQYTLTAAAVGYWAADEGPAAVLALDPGSVRGVLLAAWVIDLALTAGRAALRWVGYGRCEPAAAAVRSAGAVGWARGGVLLRTAGYALAMVPLLLGVPAAAAPSLALAVMALGMFAGGFGVLLESAVLFAWYRVLAEVAGRGPARAVAHYAGTFVAAGVMAVVGGVLAVMPVLIALSERHGQPPPARGPGRLNYGALPPEAWYSLAGLLAVATGFGLVLCWQYSRILVALRTGLAGPTGR